MGYVLVHVQLFFYVPRAFMNVFKIFFKFFPHITCDSFYSQSSIHLGQLRISQSLSNVPTILVRKVSRVVFMCLTFFCCKFSLIFASSFIFMLTFKICYFNRLKHAFIKKIVVSVKFPMINLTFPDPLNFNRTQKVATLVQQPQVAHPKTTKRLFWQEFGGVLIRSESHYRKIYF